MCLLDCWQWEMEIEKLTFGLLLDYKVAKKYYKLANEF